LKAILENMHLHLAYDQVSKQIVFLHYFERILSAEVGQESTYLLGNIQVYFGFKQIGIIHSNKQNQINLLTLWKRR
jgi:hypothetical protein